MGEAARIRVRRGPRVGAGLAWTARQYPAALTYPSALRAPPAQIGEASCEPWSTAEPLAFFRNLIPKFCPLRKVQVINEAVKEIQKKLEV
ncbi:Hypothetical predicted protein [Marmota monax]|uniref:Uncharacterized protein n=1 Tax=Marmota monax TaxID=9995 RepID=A0A5E4D4F5_MARMO|nr:hypothetical protein GHT09_013959 [Marmota monax]VTJ89093.1 Hypothetical predicted protein [Marmota monax]